MVVGREELVYLEKIGIYNGCENTLLAGRLGGNRTKHRFLTSLESERSAASFADYLAFSFSLCFSHPFLQRNERKISPLL